MDRPELRILETNPYHDAPDSACEGIYEAGKEAQLEADRRNSASIPAGPDRPELRKKIQEITFLLARRIVGEASKKNLDGHVIMQFNEKADTKLLALFPEVDKVVAQIFEEIEGFHRQCGRQDMNELRAWQAIKSKWGKK